MIERMAGAIASASGRVQGGLFQGGDERGGESAIREGRWGCLRVIETMC